VAPTWVGDWHDGSKTEMHALFVCDGNQAYFDMDALFTAIGDADGHSSSPASALGDQGPHRPERGPSAQDALGDARSEPARPQAATLTVGSGAYQRAGWPRRMRCPYAAKADACAKTGAPVALAETPGQRWFGPGSVQHRRTSGWPTQTETCALPPKTGPDGVPSPCEADASPPREDGYPRSGSRPPRAPQRSK
jgi:hypothetical protein